MSVNAAQKGEDPRGLGWGRSSGSLCSPLLQDYSSDDVGAPSSSKGSIFRNRGAGLRPCGPVRVHSNRFPSLSKRSGTLATRVRTPDNSWWRGNTLASAPRACWMQSACRRPTWVATRMPCQPSTIPVSRSSTAALQPNTNVSLAACVSRASFEEDSDLSYPCGRR
jgi:hypothetical protein